MNFLFVGTSRTNCGISPKDFATPFNKIRINVKAINLGIDAGNAYVGLTLARSNLKKYDFIVIEIFPGDPLFTSPFLKTTNLTHPFNSYLSYNLGKYLTLQNLYSIVLYNFNKSPIYQLNCHENGFVEIRHGDNIEAVQNAKRKWEYLGEKSYQKNPLFFEHYVKYCNYIKLVLKNCKTKIVFLTMPVDGKVAEIQNRSFYQDNPNSILKRCFPNALIISSNTDSILAKYHTFEDSHLDGITAKQFSQELSKILINKMFHKIQNCDN